EPRPVYLWELTHDRCYRLLGRHSRAVDGDVPVAVLVVGDRRVDRVELIHHVAPLLRGPLGACEATMPALMWLYEQLDHVHLLDLGEAQEVIACGEEASRDDVLEARSPVVAYEGCNVGSQQPPERIVEQTWVDLAQVFGVDPCPTWCVRQQRAD